jgi:hypothetical protein
LLSSNFVQDFPTGSSPLSLTGSVQVLLISRNQAIHLTGSSRQTLLTGNASLLATGSGQILFRMLNRMMYTGCAQISLPRYAQLLIENVKIIQAGSVRLLQTGSDQPSLVHGGALF